MCKKMVLWYDKPAPYGNEGLGVYSCDTNERADDGWEKWSLPIGNGYMGVNVFGRTTVERLQITENSLFNPYELGGLNNFAEMYLDFGHDEYDNYRRELDIDNAVARVSYNYNGITYNREHFTSYTDRIFVTKLTTSERGGLSFRLSCEVPFQREYQRQEGDGGGKSGTVESSDDRIILSGVMYYYNILFEGQIKVIVNSGKIENKDGVISVINADEAVIIVAVGTNYKLENRVFTEQDRHKKLAPYPHPHNMVAEILDNACKKTFEELLNSHTNDYRTYYSRVKLDLGGLLPEIPTDLLLENYKKGKHNKYLEELYFQYGRYLLISSSRKGTLPANLQGVWNRYESPPFTSGYWHNINVQMNYWHAFNTNLAEMFEAYLDYCKAFMSSAEIIADDYIKENYPKNYNEGNNGWSIGTNCYPYYITGPEIGRDKPDHSGPATGAFTAKLFWEYFDFTRDKKVLKDVTYPVISSMAKFLSKVVEPHDGKMLVTYSASPEQYFDNSYTRYHLTTGCAFDQQFIWENHKDTLLAAEILNTNDKLIDTLKEQIDLLDPVQIGKAGQIKEFREEEYYGEIGEKNHRHISHLMGLYPGTLINSNTKQWLDAARVTLNLRGDESTGWAMAHRFNLWARVKDGERTYSLLQTLLKTGTLPNLWDTHPPFQIDGNFGGTAGICEMLLQSHEGHIHVLPAIPKEWKKGEYSGLVARGNFHISVKWDNFKVYEIEILPKVSGKCRVKYEGSYFTLQSKDGDSVDYTFCDDILSFEAVEGESYIICKQA